MTLEAIKKKHRDLAVAAREERVADLRQYIKDYMARHPKAPWLQVMRHAIGRATDAVAGWFAGYVAALETRIAALEAAQKNFGWRGVYKQGEIYPAGAWTTHDGSLWIAERDTMDRPGSADSGWKLAVKKGRGG
jgi:hypothetical protein